MYTTSRFGGEKRLLLDMSSPNATCYLHRPALRLIHEPYRLLPIACCPRPPGLGSCGFPGANPRVLIESLVPSKLVPVIVL